MPLYFINVAINIRFIIHRKASVSTNLHFHLFICAKTVCVIKNFIYLCVHKINIMNKVNPETQSTGAEENALLKRNKQAPSFTTSMVRSRSQLLIERYIQFLNYDLQEYIHHQRILKVDIPPEVLRSWYPTPNWKKDIDKMIKDFMKIKGTPDADGNFDYMSLFSRAKLDNTGLHLNVDPEVLQIYIITNGTPYTSLDYNLTKYIKCSYTYEMYWEMAKHDEPRDNYTFFLTPADFNRKFSINYNVTNILEKIIIPTQKEIEQFFRDGLSPRFFTYQERRKIVGKCKKIEGWEFKIHNESRSKRQDIEAQEAFVKIDKFLRLHLEKMRLNILDQVRLMNSDKIIQLWMRLDKYNQSDTSHIRTRTGYLCYILQCYGIHPTQKKIDPQKIKEAPLFQKEEKDTAAGISYWFECLKHINNSSASEQVKSLFAKLNFYEYTEKDTESALTFSAPHDVYVAIETYFLKDFERVLLQYFPSNLKVYYHVR